MLLLDQEIAQTVNRQARRRNNGPAPEVYPVEDDSLAGGNQVQFLRFVFGQGLTSSPPLNGRGFLRRSIGVPGAVGSAGSCCWRSYRTAHFTGEPGMSCP